MNMIFNRWLPCATLAAWSTVLLYFYTSSRINSLVAPQFRIYALLAGIVLGGLSLVFLFFQADASCCSSAECGHSISRFATGRIFTFLILIVPLTVAAYYSPQGFSATAVKNRGITDDYASLGIKDRKIGPPPVLTLPVKDSSAPAAAATPAPVVEPSPGDYLQRLPDGRIVAEVLDLLYAAQDNVLRKDFEGKPVQLIGQFMPDKTSANQTNRFKAVRMFMYCCAADSRPVATLVEMEKMPDFPEMTWLKISGTAEFPLENGRRISVLKAEKVEKTEPPEEAMLY
ncbi:MAG: TIGR03943 family protein [Chthoniobacteraceae bacterium]